MRKSMFAALLLASALQLGGCLPTRLSAEQYIALKPRNDAVRVQALAGRIKWVDYARAVNANYLQAAPYDTATATQEALAYRVTLASQVDARQLSPEQYDFLWNRYVAERGRELGS